jgi:hypothetical protein
LLESKLSIVIKNMLEYRVVRPGLDYALPFELDNDA